MIIQSVLKKGYDKKGSYCEDSFIHERKKSISLFAVFDGCSSGFESCFSSLLFSKITRKFMHDLDETILSDYTLDAIVKGYFYNFKFQLSKIIVELNLKDVELQSTMIIAFYDHDTKELKVANVGDGFYSVDDQLFEIKNDKYKDKFPEDYKSRPDYFISNIEEISQDFNQWFSKLNVVTFQNPNMFSIGTDGIFSFVKSPAFNEEIDVVDYLIYNNFLDKNESGLQRKTNILKSKGYTHKDDLTIIRINNLQLS